MKKDGILFCGVKIKSYLCIVSNEADVKKKNAMYTVEQNQYIPLNAKLSERGFPMCETYYYVVNQHGKIISKKTMKVYRGKNLAAYKFENLKQAQDFAEHLNKL